MIETTTVTQRRGNRKMLYLFEQYKAAHPGEGDEIKPHLVAPWAITQGLWKRPPMEAEEVLRRLLSRALWDEYIVDPQGVKFASTIRLSQKSKRPRELRSSLPGTRFSMHRLKRCAHLSSYGGERHSRT